MDKQITNAVLMVRSSHFQANKQTLVDNLFQTTTSIDALSITKKAQQEFDAVKQLLIDNSVEVIEIYDLPEVNTPDSIFPNNWITTHADGTVALYPLFAPNRRLERRMDVLDIIESKGFEIESVVDYTTAEESDLFLEGTGSMVLDRANRIAYTALSNRTDEDLFIEFCEDFEYSPIIFSAVYQNEPIYHTNVMMSITTHLAIVCSESIVDKKERKLVSQQIKESGKEIVTLSIPQMKAFAGNVLELEGKDGQPFLIMSTTAFTSLNESQKQKINQYMSICQVDIPTIEMYGGGGVRCMLAEIFLPKN